MQQPLPGDPFGFRLGSGFELGLERPWKPPKSQEASGSLRKLPWESLPSCFQVTCQLVSSYFKVTLNLSTYLDFPSELLWNLSTYFHFFGDLLEKLL